MNNIDKIWYTAKELRERWDNMSPAMFHEAKAKGNLPKATKFGKSDRYSIHSIISFEKEGGSQQ